MKIASHAKTKWSNIRLTNLEWFSSKTLMVPNITRTFHDATRTSLKCHQNINFRLISSHVTQMSEILFSIAGQLTIIHWRAGGYAYDTNFFFP